MKQCRFPDDEQRGDITPRVGVRIETSSTPRSASTWTITPRVGVRIETYFSAWVGRRLKITPRVGVRIETPPL